MQAHVFLLLLPAPWIHAESDIDPIHFGKTMATKWMGGGKRQKNAQIDDEVWDAYKAEILREYQIGGTIAHVLKWIGAQNIPYFNPTYVQTFFSKCAQLTCD